MAVQQRDALGCGRWCERCGVKRARCGRRRAVGRVVDRGARRVAGQRQQAVFIRNIRRGRRRQAGHGLGRHRCARAVFVNADNGERRVLGDRDRAGVFGAAEVRGGGAQGVIQRHTLVGGGERDRHAVFARRRGDRRRGIGGKVRPLVRRTGINHTVLRGDAAAAQQLRDGYELIALRFERVDRAQRALHAGLVDIVDKDDRAVVRIFHDVVIHGVSIAVLPVERVDAPQDNGRGNRALDRAAGRAAGRAHHVGVRAAHALEQQALDAADLARDRRRAVAVKRDQMLISMVCKLMAFVAHAGEHGFMVYNVVRAVCAVHKERRLCAAGLQSVEQRRGVGGRAVVEGERDQLGSGRGGGWRFGCRGERQAGDEQRKRQ